MMRRVTAWVVAVTLGFVLTAGAQAPIASAGTSTRSASGLHFLVQGPDPTRAPTLVDVALVPALHRTIALDLHNVTQERALAEIGRVAGLNVVYASDLIPPSGSVTLANPAIVVSAALQTVLSGLALDLVIEPGGTIVLSARAPSPGPLTVSAQVVRGVVQDSMSRRPIVAAVVSLFDSAGQVIGRTLTVAEGRFALTPSRAARRLQVLHIGHLPVDLPLPTPGPDGSMTIDVAMARVPTHLDAMRSVGTALCPRPPDQGAGFALWGQARAEFLAAVVARDASQGAVGVLFYERDINPRTGRITQQTTALRGGSKSNTSVAARSSAAFAERGFLDANDTDSYFYGPDVDVLLDETFATTHCFHIERPSREHPRDIGIAFVPARDRPLVSDIAGDLWIDSSAHVVRALEYRYTNLRSGLFDGTLGGSVTFHVLASGVPIVERWVIQTSPFTWASVPVSLFPSRSGGTGATRESGAELLDGIWADSVRWKASLGTVAGHVLPSKNKAPGRTVVWFPGTEYTATSDSTGTFRFTRLLPGRYSVAASDEMVAPFGLDQMKDAAAEVFRDSVVRLDVTLAQTALQALALPCGQPVTFGASELLVRIQSVDSSPAAPSHTGRTLLGGVTVGRSTTLLEAIMLAEHGIEVPVRTAPINRAIGSFVVCSVPWGSTLRLRAGVGKTVTEQVMTLPTGHKLDTLTLIAPSSGRTGGGG